MAGHASDPGIFVAVTSGVAANEQGLASGLVNTSQQIGASVGMALVSTTRGARSAAPLQVGPHTLQHIQHALVGGFQAGVFVCATSALLAVLVALWYLCCVSQLTNGFQTPLSLDLYPSWSMDIP